jgi:carboxyl-terminal processing protease
LRPPFTHSNRKFHHTEAVLWQLFGPAGTPVTINFKDAKEINHSVTLMREKRLGGVTLFPSLPPMFIDEDKRVLAGGISYLWFNVFQPNHPAQLLAAIDDLDEQKPLIIDLRGNNGGSANATLEILSRFARDRFLAYHRVDRVNSTSIYVEPTNPDHRWSSVVLVDELSISAAENFAAIMQHAGLASVVGTQTPGQLLWGEGYELDNDLLAVIPIAQLIYPDGTNIEGRGVEPNLVVALRREDLLQGVDTQLRAAIELLQAQTSSMIIDDK